MLTTIKPSSISTDIGTLLGKLENDSSILIKWFAHNYLVMDADKSKLLVT